MNKPREGKVTFGLQPKDLKVIEEHVAKFEGARYSYPIWRQIGKEIGWDSLTAALFYFQLQEKKKDDSTGV